MSALRITPRPRGRTMCTWFSCDTAMRGKRRSGRYVVTIHGQAAGHVCEQHKDWLIDLWTGARSSSPVEMEAVA